MSHDVRVLSDCVQRCSLHLVPTADDINGTNDICSLLLVPTADYTNRPNEKVDTKRIPHFIDLVLYQNTKN